MHDEQQHEVELEPLGTRAQRVEPGREADDRGEQEHRQRDAVEAEFQAEAERGEAGVVRAEKLVMLRALGGELRPQPQRDERRHGEGHDRQLRGEPLGQPERDDERGAERRGDGELQELGVGEHERNEAGNH